MNRARQRSDIPGRNQFCAPARSGLFNRVYFLFDDNLHTPRTSHRLQ
ncbi:hypothetical protein CLOSYM_02331 [[Clostridium] symbiosum ATCC 14940]|uniref:Uncharacterized protein n=1 Tax=[Clostridium] symbiosum ATCC 14940 TaxID=411472 RepID=A0ABC9TXQ2_CLOSY|nr:hypothetical protein CLOSYM_02331 [[Clostridium] symbiosum ATCC 14940]